MATFVISKRLNDVYKYELVSRKGKTIFTLPIAIYFSIIVKKSFTRSAEMGYDPVLGRADRTDTQTQESRCVDAVAD